MPRSVGPDGHGRHQGLGVARRTLSALLNGHAGISPDMAIRLSKAFGRLPKSWLQLQLQYDLWQAEQRSGTIKVKHFPTPALADCSQ